MNFGNMLTIITFTQIITFMQTTNCLFVVLQLCDPVKSGSNLKVGATLPGELSEDLKRVFYTDPVTDCEWIFYVGDTCALTDMQPAPLKYKTENRIKYFSNKRMDQYRFWESKNHPRFKHFAKEQSK